MLWDLLLAIFEISWVFPSSARGTLLSWRGSFVGKRRKKAWMTALLCIFWTIWHERNRIVFDNMDFSVNWMKSAFLCNLWSWTNLYIADRPRSLVDFFDLVELYMSW